LNRHEAPTGWAGTLLSRIPEMNQECPTVALWRATGRRAAAQGDGVIAEPQAGKSPWGRHYLIVCFTSMPVGLSLP
jgi:hypothetical protein